MKTEEDKAETAGFGADWGEGEGASVANETSRLCLKESKRSFAGVPDSTVVLQ